ncbi:sulfite exporter TauE/SafE family protein [Jiella sp. MQZ9-1]|nr:sulfite exporter TauE/SafE family protein [Jiella flava]MCD2472443.1 sulfite exporter TauE/SafE family protein [Jiella flava]
MADRTGPQMLLIAAAAFIAGLARGFAGFGAALIFMPLASAVVGPKLAAPLLLIVDGIASLGLLPDAWPKADKRNIAVMVIGGLIGVPLGAHLLATMDPLALRWMIAAVVALLLALLASGRRYRGRPTPPLTVLVGAISGVFSGAAGTGGPPVVAYWLGSPASQDIVRANIVGYFAVSTVITVASYTMGGLFIWPLVPLACVTGPLYGLGLYGGTQLFGFASEATFRAIALSLIAAACLFGLPVLDPLLH